MDEFDLDPEEIRRLGHRAADMVADHVAALRDGPVFGKNLARYRMEEAPDAAKSALERAWELAPGDREVARGLLGLCERLGLRVEAARWRAELAVLGE